MSATHRPTDRPVISSTVDRVAANPVDETARPAAAATFCGSSTRTVGGV